MASSPVRLILLGASNLTRQLSTALGTALSLLDTQYPACPTEIFVVAGRGRSYGLESSLIGRSLPSILDCQMWSTLRDREAAVPARVKLALISDIGNDLGYGVEPALVEAWLETCASRLTAWGARPVIATLPVESLVSFPEWQLDVARKILFPSSAHGATELVARAHNLASKVERLAAQRDLPLVRQRPEWYGHDPVHYRRSQRQKIWATLLEPWWDLCGSAIAAATDKAPPVDRHAAPGRSSGTEVSGRTAGSPDFESRPAALRYLRLAQAWPQSSTVLGRQVRRSQPSALLAGRARVWMY